MPFDVASEVGQTNGVVDGRAHWRHLAIAVERLCTAAEWSLARSGDATRSQIILGNLVIVVVVVVAVSIR